MGPWGKPVSVVASATPFTHTLFVSGEYGRHPGGQTPTTHRCLPRATWCIAIDCARQRQPRARTTCVAARPCVRRRRVAALRPAHVRRWGARTGWGNGSIAVSCLSPQHLAVAVAAAPPLGSSTTPHSSNHTSWRWCATNNTPPQLAAAATAPTPPRTKKPHQNPKLPVENRKLSGSDTKICG